MCPTPDVSLQINNLVRRATARFFVLRHYSSFMPGSDLLKLYCSLVRSSLEYSSVTYSSMLTQYQSNQLENIQKRCLRCMFGWTKSYAELLEESGLPTLKARRETAVKRFAEKALDNPNYQHWFTANPSQRMSSQRYSKPLLEKFARSSRLYNSPIFHMTRVLNGSPNDPPPHTVGEAVAFDHALNDPFA